MSSGLKFILGGIAQGVGTGMVLEGRQRFEAFLARERRAENRADLKEQRTYDEQRQDELYDRKRADLLADEKRTIDTEREDPLYKARIKLVQAQAEAAADPSKAARSAEVAARRDFEALWKRVNPMQEGESEAAYDQRAASAVMESATRRNAPSEADLYDRAYRAVSKRIDDGMLDEGDRETEIRAYMDQARGYSIGGAGSGKNTPTENPTIAAARDAIARGAPRDKVIERLRAAGITPPSDL